MLTFHYSPNKEDRILENQQMTKKQNIMQVIKFVLFSASAAIIQIGSFTLLQEVFGIREWALSYIPSLVLSVLWNFTFNRRYTFKSVANVPVAMLKVFAFYCVFTPLSLWWGTALEAAGWSDYLVQIVTMLANLVTEFLYCRFFVYRNNMNNNDIAAKEREKENQ